MTKNRPKLSKVAPAGGHPINPKEAKR